jgi:hypothetical protein
VGTVVGPVLRCSDGYRVNSWTTSEGVTRGYSYRRIEDARYARTTAISTLAQDGSAIPIACETLDEFIAEIRAYEMRAAV